MGGRFGLFDACGLARLPRVADSSIGAAGAKDLAEALKVNTSLTNLTVLGARATAVPPPPTFRRKDFLQCTSPHGP